MRGRRVSLRPVTGGDAELIHQWVGELAMDASSAASYAGTLATSPESLRRELEQGTTPMLMIVGPKGDPVGVMEWRWVGSPRARTAEIGVSVGMPQLWNLGYGADAYDTLLAYLFLAENAHRVQFSVAKSNVRMLGSLARYGAPVLEGIRRESSYLDGVYEDVLDFGILRSEFDHVLSVAPDLAGRVQARLDLQQAGGQMVRKHLIDSADSSIQHLLTGVAPNPLAGRVA